MYYILFYENEYDGIFLANVKYEGIKDHTQTFFSYLVDADEGESTPGPSVTHDVATYGARFTGKFDQLKYLLSYAHQTDFKDSDDIDVSFYHAELSYTLGDLTPGIGYAYHQGSDNAGGFGFANLFSTAHVFNGWADQFIKTPTQGLVDLYVTVGGEAFSGKWSVTYHDFSADEKSAADDLGSEIDAIYKKSFNKHKLRR